MACASNYALWRTTGGTTTATGTTCTLYNNIWTSTAASGSPDTTISYRTCTSSGQSLCWAQSPPPQYRRGPNRRAELHREHIGTRFGGCGYANHLFRRYHRDSAEVRKLKQEKLNAHNESMKLLKQWLSEMEYNYLMEQGQLELPSQYEKDVIYIVKKDTHEKVKLAKKNKVACIHKPLIIETGEACINVDMEYPVGDSLLAKIALLKSDEKEFLKIANITHYNPPITAAYGAIVEMRGTNFWFVLLDDQGRVTHAHETDPSLRFEHVTHEEVPCGDNVHNNIIIRNAHQYFIWAPAMLEAGVRARELWRERNGPVPGYMATWDPMQEHQELAHNADSYTYTVTRLGQEEPYNEQH